MTGFLSPWPELLALTMFPLLVWIYARQARTEELEAEPPFGDVYRRHAVTVPAFVAVWSKRSMEAS
ncbi:MAG: hypothetical protein U1D35_05700 [Paracoccaceae bacterium]|nr:hypothetical protein [Paracoccaceae bacterium]